MMGETKKVVEELLTKLEKKPDDVASSVSLVGRACSRSEENLHLAIATGIVAIPISNIDDITTVLPNDPFTVAVKFRRADEVKFLRRMPVMQNLEQPDSVIASNLTPLRKLFQQIDEGDDGGDIEWPPIYGPGVNTSLCVTTVTDGNACDDFECQDFQDDLAQ
jgi:hypothetical protein